MVAELTSISRQHSDAEGFAKAELTESDIVFRLGAPFGHLARYRTIGSDLQIPELGFEIEVKYFRPFPKPDGISTVAMPWKNVQKDVAHLLDCISGTRKGAFAFVIGWPAMLPWRALAQLGRGSGQNPRVNAERLLLLPFLEFDPNGTVRSIQARYNVDEGSTSIPTANGLATLNWHRYGTANDAINLAVLW